MVAAVYSFQVKELICMSAVVRWKVDFSWKVSGCSQECDRLSPVYHQHIFMATPPMEHVCGNMCTVHVFHIVGNDYTLV